MKSLLYFSAIVSAATNISSSYFSRYYKLNLGTNSCIHQNLSSANGTAPVISGCLSNTDNIYEAIEDYYGIRLRHINDNKCLYIEPVTNELKSWECWNDTNMRFIIEDDTTHGLRIKHDLSSLCVEDISGILKGISCAGIGHPASLLTEVFPYMNTASYIGDYNTIKFINLNTCINVYNPVSTTAGSCNPSYDSLARMIDAGNDKMRLLSLKNGNCAYIDGVSKLLRFYPCWNDPNMSFYLFKDDNNETRIVHELTGLCLGRDNSSGDAIGVECDAYNHDVLDSFVSHPIYNDVTSVYKSNTYKIKVSGECLKTELTAPYNSFMECMLNPVSSYEIEVASKQTYTFWDNGDGTVLLNRNFAEGSEAQCVYKSGTSLKVADCDTDPWVVNIMRFRVLETIYGTSGQIKLQHVDSGLCISQIKDDLYAPNLTDCDMSGADLTVTLF